jgi:hypothetical protein
VHADGQGHRHHRRQPLGNGSHGQGDGCHDGLHQRIAAQNTEHENQAHNNAGDEGQALAQRIELHLQRSGAFLRRVQQAADAAHLGAHAGGGHNQFQAATCNDGVHEHHVDAFGQRMLAGRQRPGVLAYGMGFAGQRRLGHFGVVRHQHAAIGGNPVARLEQHEVARHQFLGGNFQNPSAAPHPGVLRQHLLQRGQRRLGAVLLIEAQRGVEHHHDQDHHRVLEVADRRRQHDGAEQHHHQHVFELVEKLEPRRARLFLGELVGAVTGQPLRRLVGGQPPGRVGLEVGADLAGSLRMPVLGRDGLCRLHVSVFLKRVEQAPPPAWPQSASRSSARRGRESG